VGKTREVKQKIDPLQVAGEVVYPAAAGSEVTFSGRLLKRIRS
jgi:hypothetical protein